MTAKKSFLIILRVIFVLFSCQFAFDAAYYWENRYSYSRRFIDFVPDLSLAFVLWTIMVIIIAFILWLIIYCFLKLIPKTLTTDYSEHILIWFMVIVLAGFIKKIYFGGFSFGNLIGLSHFMILIIGSILVAVVIWVGRKHTKHLLNGFNNQITPLVWFFILMFILAVPLSFLKQEYVEHRYEGNNIHINSSGIKFPNIILITWDTLSAEDMHVYGYNRLTTPFISEWAKDSFLFQRVYASSNSSISSAMSLMTGQRIWTHGVWYDALVHPVKNNYENLAKLLKDYGYDIFCFTQVKYVHPRTLGMGNYFVVKDEERLMHGQEEGLIKNLRHKLSSFLGNRNMPVAWVFEFLEIQAESFLPQKYVPARPPEKLYNSFLEFASGTEFKALQRPFFVWLHTLSPHDPYLPPEPFLGTFEDNVQNKSPEVLLKSTISEGEYPPERQPEVDNLRKRYDELILYSDKQFEIFWSRLDNVVDLSNTIVIFSADHGESFSHGYLSHDSPYLYEPVVHIPLIIKVPGRKKGKVIDMVSSQIDIAPTILELAGISVPAWMEGRSLVPLMKDKFLQPRPVFSMHLKMNRAFHLITNGTIVVWDGDYKLIHYLQGKKSLLFNLRTDPGETRNLFDEEPEISQRLLNLINENLLLANERIANSNKRK